MRPKRYIAYYRVSTEKQGRSGLGLHAQQRAVAEYAASQGTTLIYEFTEVESGCRSARPGLSAALAACRVHQAILLIAKLDRLARNVAFVSSLMDAGVDFEAVDFPQANRLTIHILAAVAEHEAKLISERTKLALRAAQERGASLGGYRGRCGTKSDCKRAREARTINADRRARDLEPVIQMLKQDGADTLAQLAAGMNKRKIPSSRGGAWSPSSVQRILKRITTLMSDPAPRGT